MFRQQEEEEFEVEDNEDATIETSHARNYLDEVEVATTTY